MKDPGHDQANVREAVEDDVAANAQTPQPGVRGAVRRTHFRAVGCLGDATLDLGQVPIALLGAPAFFRLAADV
jgi:hypothetical protein